jgi:protein-disulfide isomerase
MRRRPFLAGLLLPAAAPAVAGGASLASPDETVLAPDDDERALDAAQRAAVTALGPRIVDAADPVAGNPLGDVLLVVFTDPLCPFCRRLVPTVYALLDADHAAKVVWKDIPVLGPASQLEARALLAAQRQGGYEALQRALAETPGPLGRDDLRDLADALDLDGNALLRDLDDPAIKVRLAANIALAQFLHVEGTPATVVGGRVVPGAVHLDDLAEIVAGARATGAGTPAP